MKEIQSIAKVIFIVTILFISKNSIASPQLPDYVIYKGDTIPVYNLILEQYFKTVSKPDQGSLFGLKFRDGASFNCWRGYQAIYSIENDSLFLNEIITCGELYNNKPLNQEDSKNRIQDIFGDSYKNNKVFVDWYSGKFSLPNGNLLRWDGVFHKIFEKEILIQVGNGTINRISYINNYEDNPTRVNRRYQDTISNVLFKELEKFKWKKIDKFDPSEIYLVTIGENGKVSNVSMVEYQVRDSIKKYWDRNEYKYCIRSVRKALKDLNFDIIKKDGEPIEEKVIFEIWLGEDGKLKNWTY
ncbi:hypothetical protein EO244_16655 [Ancylomarina salipaludis]|uniref:Uncharacterized protein n=1 Tax=Ancylomarina salipaludis TaxID=2501299 RepID=A0A4Q1JIK1_9BACT|nr:hypothetical protein [Ancylomarina salipaludis]RXQ87172.1 hypothetical protein EO244_16655 [Ancylomarina salipaludis]